MTDGLHFSTEPFNQLASELEVLLSGANPTALLGPELSRLTARIPSIEQVTPGALARLSLLNDALCVAERAIRKDGSVSQAELAYVEPLVRETHKYLSRVRSLYRDTVDLDHHGIGSFLEQHANDTQQFGGKCKATSWLGLGLCQRASNASGDQHYIDQYRDVVARTLDELFDRVGSGTSGQKQEIVDELNKLLPAPRPERDRREAVYCSPDSPEVFHAVAHGAEVFEIDPFDVETIHPDARLAFTRLVDRAADAKFGKILLVKGEAGSGKTHLMRAFRNKVHGEQIGFVGYLQMSTRVSSYSRYLLSNVIDSWDRPFWGAANPDAAILYLSDAVVSSLPAVKVEALRDDTLSELELHDLVNYAVDDLLKQPRFEGAEIDLLRMMLYLQRREPTRRARVLKFLRCEPMNQHDRNQIGGVFPFEGDEGPPRMLSALGKLVWMTGNGALVLLVDQLEDVYNLDDAANRFRLAMDTLRYVTDHVPTSVVVIACLEDFYDKLRAALNKPLLERIELDPDPVRLTAGRSLDEIEAIVGQRLRYLFEQKNVVVRDDEPLYPFRHEELAARVQHRTRDVLDWCRQHHETSIAAGKIASPKPAGPKPVPTPDLDPVLIDLSQAWNDHKANAETPPDDEAALLALLSWAVSHVPREFGSTEPIVATKAAPYVDVNAAWTKLSIGLCEKSSAGGGLGKQVEALIAHARGRQTVPVALRSSEYPPPGKTKVAQLLKDVIQMGGRRIVIPNAEWRAIAALRSFCELRKNDPSLSTWLINERPLSTLTAIRELLDLDASTLRNSQRPPSEATVASIWPVVAVARTPEPAGAPPTGPAVRAPSTATRDFTLGQTRGLAPHPVVLAPSTLVTHAAFLGSSGSGKTTLALAIIENLLAQGVPVLMIDRKGDLGAYARSEFWKSEPSAPEAAELFRRLRERVQVCVYTPGEPRGRPLTLPVIPSDLGELPGHERGIAARYAASALGAMMGYKKAKTDDTRLGILGKAIELVGRESASSAPGIGQLVSVLDDEDPELVALVGKLDTKHFRALVENLETLRLRYEHLLREDGERLSPELLFGLDGSAPARARLSIVSTKFLGDNAAIDFWIARLLGELSRWASRSPASGLQAVLFLDEADIYLPAQSKPATKEPMLDLLKRARSAGLGVFLATQSPGDLDYRCRDNIRTWFVGRVAEKTAIEKMKPLLSEARINVSTKLPTAKVGEFFKLQDGDVVEIKASSSLMKTVQMSEDEIVELAARRC